MHAYCMSACAVFRSKCRSRLRSSGVRTLTISAKRSGRGAVQQLVQLSDPLVVSADWLSLLTGCFLVCNQEVCNSALLLLIGCSTNLIGWNGTDMMMEPPCLGGVHQTNVSLRLARIPCDSHGLNARDAHSVIATSVAPSLAPMPTGLTHRRRSEIGTSFTA